MRRAETLKTAGPLKTKTAALSFVLLAFFAANSLSASLITNPPLPIQYRVTLNPIIVSDTNGSNTAEFFGTPTQEQEIKDFIDTIWAQAGIDIEWQAPEFWSDDFVNTGTPGNNNPRPNADLTTIRNMADAQNRNDLDATVINIYFVEIAAGFSDVSENTANGLAFVGGNGITQHVGDNLPGFLAGQEVVASVVAHEIGHNLGLSHLVEVENLMQPGGSPNPGERLNAAQIAIAQASSFSVAIPEPGTLILLVGFSAVGILPRRRAA